jgi:hypothetical protein
MKKEVFDQRIYDRFSDGNWQREYDFEAAIKQLEIEGFPTALEFIREITKDDDSFKNHINELQRQRLSGGFVPKGEREMVHQAFSDLYERLAKKIASLRSSLNSGLVIKAEGDTVVIDKTATDELMRKKATIEIDTKKGLEYYAKFIAVIDAHKELREYEKANGMPDTIQLNFNDQTPFGFELNMGGTITEDTFANVMRYSLQKK